MLGQQKRKKGTNGRREATTVVLSSPSGCGEREEADCIDAAQHHQSTTRRHSSSEHAQGRAMADPHIHHSTTALLDQRTPGTFSTTKTRRESSVCLHYHVSAMDHHQQPATRMGGGWLLLADCAHKTSTKTRRRYSKPRFQPFRVIT